MAHVTSVKLIFQEQNAVLFLEKKIELRKTGVYNNSGLVASFITISRRGRTYIYIWF